MIILRIAQNIISLIKQYRFCITITLLLISLPVISQVREDWVVTYNGIGNLNDVGYDIALDSMGNVYVTGWSNGGEANLDIVTIKYNPLGEQQWVATYNGIANGNDYPESLTIDAFDNIYVTGSIEGNGTGRDCITIKYDNDGIEQWSAIYNGLGNKDDVSLDITTDGSNCIFIAGASYSTSTNCDYITIKYNTLGQEQWVATYDGENDSYDIARKIDIDNQGNVYVAGDSEGDDNHFDYTTAKYNNYGDIQWVTRYDGPGAFDDSISDLVADDKYIYITGKCCFPETHYDYTTIKYNKDGIEQWIATYSSPGYGNDKGKCLAVDEFGNVYVTGFSYTWETNWDYTTIKYNNNGIEQWAARYNGSGNQEDWATSIAIDKQGNVYVAGSTQASEIEEIFDYTTIKYNNNGVQQWIVSYNGIPGGSDYVRRMTIDSLGNVYVTGESERGESSHDFTTIKYNQNVSVDNEVWMNY